MSSTSDHGSHHVTLDEIITTVIMARVTDFFGFFVYAIASALVFPSLFFPNQDPVIGTLYSFAIFSLAFLARPFGAYGSRLLNSRIGREGTVLVALMILGTATVAVGMLPGYDYFGPLAPILLAALRIAQGIGLGGAWDGLTLQLQNAAPKGRKGLYSMVPQLGGPIGFIVAAALFYVLTDFLTEEEFFRFGWRFAFFAVMAVNVVSLFARIRLLSADFGVDKEIKEVKPISDLLRNQWQPIMLSALLPLASYALFHLVTVFPLAYDVLYDVRPVSEILLIQLFGATLAVFSVIASGILADRYGRRRVMMGSTILIALIGLSMGLMNQVTGVFLPLGFIILGLSYGQASSIVPGRFEEGYRYSGAALATNLSWIFGAAFAPFVALGLTALFGLWAAGLYLLSGAIVTFVALSWLQRVQPRQPR